MPTLPVGSAFSATAASPRSHRFAPSVLEVGVANGKVFVDAMARSSDELTARVSLKGSLLKVVISADGVASTEEPQRRRVELPAPAGLEVGKEYAVMADAPAELRNKSLYTGKLVIPPSERSVAWRPASRGWDP